MDRIRVTRAESPLRQYRWTFCFFDRGCTLYLDSYEVLERPSTRHKFRVIQQYLRLDKRHSNISVDDAPLPDDVADQAKDAMASRISVKKWDL